MRFRTIALLATLVVAAAPGTASASEIITRNASNVKLQVNAAGQALVTYDAEGKHSNVLVWGAVNAIHPTAAREQVAFKIDYSGGYGTFKRPIWKTFKNACGRYDGPQLHWLVAACKAPDGSYWALQRWQRRLPLLGFAPWLPEHTRWELHVSHWNTELPVLEMYTNWTYGFQWQGVFGRLTYLGHPVYGFSTTREGNPRERYSRNVYIDTYNSVYGSGWMRESGILTHRTTGTFCHSFVPQRPFPGYPSQDMRPPAPGERYRVTVMGPGVTPVLMTEVAGLPAYNQANPEHVRFEADANATFDRVMAGDRICRHER
jgi:hypothetical protein